MFVNRSANRIRLLLPRTRPENSIFTGREFCTSGCYVDGRKLKDCIREETEVNKSAFLSDVMSVDF